MRMIKMEDFTDDYFCFEAFEDLAQVEQILLDVRDKKDSAIRNFSLKFDHVKVDEFKIGPHEIENAYSSVDKGLIKDIKTVVKNVEIFAGKQFEQYGNFEHEIEPGVVAGQRIIPLERVGIYVPGGRFPLLSSLIMGVTPARVAGVKEVICCSPPLTSGSVHPAILVAADISGVDEVYRIGGAHAIGAMAYGTQSVKKVDKIVGPGNNYVTAAKKRVYGQVGIDFIAGPSEILIIADKYANPSFIASDLIAQAEHDVNAKPLLVTDSENLSNRVIKAVEKQLKGLETENIASQSLEKNGIIVIVNNLDEAVAFANRSAPEHLELQIKNPESLIPRLRNYGSLFIGEYASEVLGDYSSGLNHILPTNFASRYSGGLSVKDFFKIQTTLKVNKQGLLSIGPVAQNIALAEGLYGHANSIIQRLK